MSATCCRQKCSCFTYWKTCPRHQGTSDLLTGLIFSKGGKRSRKLLVNIGRHNEKPNDFFPPPQNSFSFSIISSKSRLLSPSIFSKIGKKSVTSCESNPQSVTNLLSLTEFMRRLENSSTAVCLIPTNPHFLSKGENHSSTCNSSNQESSPIAPIMS